MCSGCKGVLLDISFPGEGKTYRVWPSPRWLVSLGMSVPGSKNLSVEEAAGRDR